MQIEGHDKSELLEDWVEGELKRTGPRKLETLHFGSKSMFYVEGIRWFEKVVNESDRFSIDCGGRVHLNGGK